MFKKNQNGVTLVALVVTIVVLLILAGVSISLVVGNNGIVKRAQEARDEHKAAAANEAANMEEAKTKIDDWVANKVE